MVVQVFDQSRCILLMKKMLSDLLPCPYNSGVHLPTVTPPRQTGNKLRSVQKTHMINMLKIQQSLTLYWHSHIFSKYSVSFR